MSATGHNEENTVQFDQAQQDVYGRLVKIAATWADPLCRAHTRSRWLGSAAAATWIHRTWGCGLLGLCDHCIVQVLPFAAASSCPGDRRSVSQCV